MNVTYCTHVPEKCSIKTLLLKFNFFKFYLNVIDSEGAYTTRFFRYRDWFHEILHRVICIVLSSTTQRVDLCFSINILKVLDSKIKTCASESGFTTADQEQFTY